ncbi:ATP-binding protein [Streptosporangium sp. NPDC000396]|uniref:ATP-binding protein n=1 Tax=Streptosporangium sp. NPDC000396 TaxID=3366185 RepID=UPI003682EA8A
MDTLIGRHDETSRLAALLDAARQGQGGALVVKGEPGIGKSALLDWTERSATGFLTMRASGAEFETELPFAALHQLSSPLFDRLPALPTPHRTALEVAFGLDAGDPDPFLVGAATLGLLAETTRERPLLCLVDDAHWLDNASVRALAFLARRVAAEPIAVVFAAREPSGLPELDALPGLSLAGLAPRAGQRRTGRAGGGRTGTVRRPRPGPGRRGGGSGLPRTLRSAHPRPGPADRANARRRRSQALGGRLRSGCRAVVGRRDRDARPQAAGRDRPATRQVVVRPPPGR